MTVPQVIPTPVQPFIPQVSLQNVVTKTGTIAFYPADAAVDSILLLTNDENFKSASGALTDLYGDNTFIDFAQEFNNPLIVEGQITINIPSLIINSFGSSQNGTHKVYANIIKTSGGTETQLFSGAITHSVTSLGSGSSNIKNLAYTSDLSRAYFNVGDTITFRMYRSVTSQQGSLRGYIGCDPADRTTGTAETISTGARSTLNIPVKLE